jgi:hypothetical protein
MLQPDFSVEDRLDTLKDSSMESADDATMMQAVQPGEQVVVSQSLMKFQKTAVLTTVGALLGMVLIVGAVVLFANHGSNKGKGQANNLENFPVTTSVLSGLTVSPKSAPQLGVASAKQLVVNGQLEVGDTLVISPSAKPKAAVPGQIYYDKVTNAPYFYNGTEFISLAQTPVPQHVASIGGTSGQISVGSGLQVTAGQLSLSTDAIRALTGPKVASLVSGSATLAISQDGNGNYTLSDSALVGAGSAGQIAFYTGSGTLGASALSQSGTTVTVGGTLAVDTIQQTVAGNPIVVNAGNDGITFTANGINYQLPASGGANQVICTTGAPCAAGGGSLVVLQPGGAQLDNGSGSSVFINNTGGGNLLQLQGSGSDRFVVTNTGNTTIAGSVTISSLTTAGIVQVNGAGLLSSSAVDRNSATLFSNALSVSNGGTGLTAIPANGIVFGNGTGVLQSTAAAANSILTTNGTNVPVLAQTLPSVVQGNITTTGTLTSGSIGNGFGAISTANNITTSGGIQGGSLTITSGNFTVDAAGNVVVKGTGTIQGSGGVFIGVSNTTNGKLTFYNSSNGHFMQLQGLAPAGQDSTVTIPASSAANDTVCLFTLGNCVGASGAVSTSGGSQFYIPKYTNLGATQLGSSLLYDNGTTVGVNTSTPGASYKFDVSGNTHVSGTETIGSGLTVSAGGATIAGNSVVTGTLTGLTALTSSGAITFSGLSTGVVHANASGVLSSSNVVLGTETSGNYVASLGTLTGLTTTGNGTAGSTPTLSVTYGNVANTAVEGNKQLTVTASTGLSGGGTLTLGSGGTVSLSVAYGSTAGTAVQGNSTLTVTAGTGLSGGGTVTLGANGSTSLSVAYGSAAGTAVQGNTTLTCASGTGNLTGGGTSITLGAGGTCGALNIVSSPTLSGTLTVTGSGGIVIGAASTTDGVLKLANATSAFLGSVKVEPLAQATVYTLPDPGAATATICLDTGNCRSSGGGVTTSGGTNGKLARFSGSQTIVDSTLSESGSTLTASGNVVIQGANSLTLGTASTSDGSIKFFNASGTHYVTLQAPSTDPASNLTFKLPSAYGANGDCLKGDGAGGLSLSSCTGGGGGGSVTSLDAQTGALTLSNSTGSSGVITIDDASTTQKGIAQFNATNFSVTGGVVNTAQGISTAATPTFAGLSLTTALGVGSGGTGANTFTSNGILYGNGTGPIQATGAAANSILATNGSNVPTLTNTLPSTVQGNITATGILTSGSIASGFGTISTANAITTTVALQGGSLKLTNGGNGNLATLASANIAQNTTYTLPDPGAATATICLDTGNCRNAGGGVSTTGGTSGKLAKFNGSQTLADSNLSESSTTLTYAGNAVINAGLGFTGNLINVQLSGASKLSVTETGNTTVAGNLVVSGTGSSTFAGTLTSSGALTVSSGGALITGNSSITGTLSVSGLASFTGDIQVGTPASTIGSISLTNATSGRMVVLQGLNPSGTGNATIQFPTIAGGTTDTVCLLAKGNCTGSGISGSGTQNKIPKFGSGGTSVADSSINDDGTTVLITNENFSQTGTGTFGTGTGTVSLNGATTVTGTSNFTVAGGTTSLGGAATVTGLTTLNGGLTAVGAIAINTTGTASTSIGNSSGGLTLTSSTWNVSSAGAVSGVTTLSVSGAITAATSSNTINGLIINAGVLSGVAGITTSGGYTQSGTAGNTFTGAAIFSASGTGLSVSNDATVGGTLNVTSSTGIVLGASGIDGLLNLKNATNSNITALKAAAPTGSGTATITLPAIPGGTSDTVCLLTKANCAGAGGAILNNGGTQNYVLRFSNSGATQVGNSLLYDDTNFVGLNTTSNNGTLSVVANGTQAGAYILGPASGTNAVATLNGGGGTGKLLQLQNSGSTVLAVDTIGKLLFGSAADTNLYRSSAGILKTDGDLQVVGKGYAGYGTASQLTFGDIFGTGKSGIYLGNSNDTNLYRSTANTLKTDSAFVTGGTLTVGTLAASSSNLLCLDASSVIASCAPTAGTNSFILNSTSLQSAANFNFQVSAAATVGGAIRGAVAQTGDLFQLQNSSGTILSKFDASGILRGADASGSNVAGSALTLGGGQGTGTGNGGNIAFNIYKAGSAGSSLNTTSSTVLTLSGTDGSATFQGATDTATAFRLQDTVGSTYFNFDTLGSNLIDNSNFETNTTGWSTGSQTTSDAFFGTGSLTIPSFAPGATVTYSPTVSPSTTYTFSFYAKATGGNISPAEYGYINSSTANDCTSGFGFIGNSWTRYSCTFTTPSSLASFKVYVGSSVSASTRGLFLDGVKLEKGATLTSYQSGNIITLGNTTGAVAQTINIGTNATANSSTNLVLGSTVGTSAITIQSGTAGTLVKGANSTTAFQIQNAAGSSLFTADTANSVVTVGGGGGVLQAWANQTNTLPATVTSTQMTQGNGYAYVVNGVNGAIYIGKIRSDGSITWSTAGVTNPVGTNGDSGVAYYSGYLYIVGGGSGSTPSALVYVSKVAPDGTLGTFVATSSLNTARQSIRAAVANGYLYAVSGATNPGTITSSAVVEHAKINADGTLGTWTADASLPSARWLGSVASVNNRLYYVSGLDNFGGSGQTTVYMATPNSSTGAVTTWSTLTSVNSASVRGSTVAINGYLYNIDGGTQIVEAAPIASDGTLGSWTNLASLNVARTYTSSIAYNGYIYTVGGGNLNTVSYTSTQRIKVAGSLDLVGADSNASGTDLLNSGELSSGNTHVYGTLNVQGATTLNNNLAVYGNALVQSAANSTTAFQIQNASGVSLFTADTLNSGVTITSSAASGNGLSITGNNNIAGNAVSASRTVTGTAISKDASTSASSSNASSLTTAGSLTGGSGKVLIITVTNSEPGCFGGGCIPSPSFTFNGSAISPTLAKTNVACSGDCISTGTNYNTRIYYLVNPSAVTGTVSASFGFATNNILLTASMWSNINTTNPVVRTNSTTGTGTAASVSISSNSAELVVDSMVDLGTGAPTQGGSQTSLGSINQSGANAGASYATAGVSSMSWTVASGQWTDSAVVFAPATTITGSVASFSSSCTSCDDTGTILVLSQQTAAATGPVLQIQNAGSGPSIQSANNASGFNAVGQSLSIAGGQGTGTGAGGSINLQIVKPGSSGSSLNTTLSTVFTLSGSDGSALFKNATNGATAFQIQSSTAAAAFIVSTNNVSTGYNAANATLKVAADSGTSRSINAAGTVNASGADYAEWIPWSGEKPVPGTIVDYQGSKMVVSSPHTAAFIGNDAISDQDHANLVTFTGQVPVRITGPVHAGDYLVPGADGTAHGVSPASASLGDYVAKVGTALADSTTDAVQALVSGPGANPLFNPQAGNNFADINVSGSLRVNNLEVSGDATFKGNIIVQGHIITAGSVPLIQAVAAAGSGAVVNISGNDTAGTITITTGSAPYAGDLARIIFSKSYGEVPRIVISASDDNAAGLRSFKGATTLTDFRLRAKDAPAPNMTYTFDYFIAQ